LVPPHLVALAAALVLEVQLVVEDRVLEHLLVHEVGQLNSRELQEPDRLLQLRCHHQLLRQLQFLAHFHRHRTTPYLFPVVGCFSCDRRAGGASGMSLELKDTGMPLEEKPTRFRTTCKGLWPGSCFSPALS